MSKQMCEKCMHLKVCAYRKQRTHLENEIRSIEKEERPFDIVITCSEYHEDRSQYTRGLDLDKNIC